MKSRKMNVLKRIAVVVHEERKTDLIEWSYFNRLLLQPHEIIAVGAAGKILEGTLNESVYCLSTDYYDGCRELTNLIGEGKVDAIIFFWKQALGNTEKAMVELFKAAHEANILIAPNRITADFILSSEKMKHEFLLTDDPPYTPDKSLHIGGMVSQILPAV